jgi:hypothetical protein
VLTIRSACRHLSSALIDTGLVSTGPFLEPGALVFLIDLKYSQTYHPNIYFMRKYVQLSIPAPCHEDWNKMTTIDKGKFCQACQRNVIDFTAMSDEQLFAYFKKPVQESMCGRFMARQLDRRIEMPAKKIPWVKYFIHVALPAFLFTVKAKAQGKMKIDPIVVVSKTGDKISGDTIIPAMIRNIKGQVTDENGTGIPYATIVYSDKSGHVITDSMGTFSLHLSYDHNLKLEISSVGYESKIIDLSYFRLWKSVGDLHIQLKQEAKNLEEVTVKAIDLSSLGGFFGGLVMQVHTISYIDSFRDWLWRVKEPASIYPNPVQRGASLKIKLNLRAGMDYNIDIWNIDGKFIMSKKIIIQSKDHIEEVAINMLFVPGTYLIKISDKKKNTVHSGKVIVL